MFSPVPRATVDATQMLLEKRINCISSLDFEIRNNGSEAVHAGSINRVSCYGYKYNTHAHVYLTCFRRNNSSLKLEEEWLENCPSP